MKGPILGIIAVFCLQLGFTLYTAIDREIGEMVAVGEIRDGTTLLANLDQDYDVPESLISAPASQRPVLYSRPTFVSSKRSEKLPASRSVTFEPVLIAYQKYPEIKFKTETPRVTPPVVSEAKTFQASAEVRTGTVTRTKREKRSFFSKSVAVIRKPYDWLKAVGSRLN
ncbi:MAG: hypothetical protein ABJB34_04280 [Acidobacteriota bacterium]